LGKIPPKEGIDGALKRRENKENTPTWEMGPRYDKNLFRKYQKETQMLKAFFAKNSKD